jgi:hypothetical protein
MPFGNWTRSFSEARVSRESNPLCVSIWHWYFLYICLNSYGCIRIQSDSEHQTAKPNHRELSARSVRYLPRWALMKRLGTAAGL